MGFSGGEQTRYKKYPCKAPCKRNSYETICENIVSTYQTLVFSLPRMTTLWHRRPKTHFMTGLAGQPSNNKICSPTLILWKTVSEEICKVFYSIQHWKHTWEKKTEYDREIQLEKLKREHQFTLIKRHVVHFLLNSAWLPSRILRQTDISFYKAMLPWELERAV